MESAESPRTAAPPAGARGRRECGVRRLDRARRSIAPPRQLGIDPVQARLAMPKTQAGMIDCYIQEVDRALEAWFTPERLAGLKIREKIRAPGVAAAGDHGPGARSRPPRAGDPRHAAEPAAGAAHLVAHGRPHVAHRRRHQHRLQPLHQAHDARRGLRLDAAGLARRRQRGLGGHRAPSSTAASTT